MTQTTYQVILSSDGKHTVIATSDNQGEMKLASAWAKITYDAIVERYGLKSDQKTPGVERDGGEEEEDAPICKIHKVPMVQVQGRNGPFWSCHEKNEDGSWCHYKPPILA